MTTVQERVHSPLKAAWYSLSDCDNQGDKGKGKMAFSPVGGSANNWNLPHSSFAHASSSRQPQFPASGPAGPVNEFSVPNSSQATLVIPATFPSVTK